MSEGFDEILAASSPRVRGLATQTRALVRDVMPDVVEVPWTRREHTPHAGAALLLEQP